MKVMTGLGLPVDEGGTPQIARLVEQQTFSLIDNVVPQLRQAGFNVTNNVVMSSLLSEERRVSEVAKLGHRGVDTVARDFILVGLAAMFLLFLARIKLVRHRRAVSAEIL